MEKDIGRLRVQNWSNKESMIPTPTKRIGNDIFALTPQMLNKMLTHRLLQIYRKFRKYRNLCFCGECCCFHSDEDEANSKAYDKKKLK